MKRWAEHQRLTLNSPSILLLARPIGHRPPSRRFATIKLPFPLAHDPHCILLSTLLCHRSPLSPVTSQAAQPPEFSPCGVVGLTWSPLLILPSGRLAALIRPFLEPNFPRRWSDSDVGGLANLVGRCLILRPALPSSLSFLLPF